MTLNPQHYIGRHSECMLSRIKTFYFNSWSMSNALVNHLNAHSRFDAPFMTFSVVHGFTSSGAAKDEPSLLLENEEFVSVSLQPKFIIFPLILFATVGVR